MLWLKNPVLILTHLSLVLSKIRFHNVLSKIRLHNVLSKIRLHNVLSQIRLHNVLSQIRLHNVLSKIRLHKVLSKIWLHNVLFVTQNAQALRFVQLVNHPSHFLQQELAIILLFRFPQSSNLMIQNLLVHLLKHLKSHRCLFQSSTQVCQSKSEGVSFCLLISSF